MTPSDGRLVQLSHEEYLAAPGFSASRAKVVHASSPAHALVYTDPTPAMDAGSAFHALLLNNGPQVQVVEARDWRTDAARAQRDAAHKAGRVPLLPHAFDRLAVAAKPAPARARAWSRCGDGQVRP